MTTPTLRRSGEANDALSELLALDLRARRRWLLTGLGTAVVLSGLGLIFGLGQLNDPAPNDSLVAARAPAGYVVLGIVLPLIVFGGGSVLGYRYVARPALLARWRARHAHDEEACADAERLLP